MSIEFAPRTSIDASGNLRAGLQRRAGVEQFEAVLFASALKPIADSLGFYGEIVTGALGSAIARELERAKP